MKKDKLTDEELLALSDSLVNFVRAKDSFLDIMYDISENHGGNSVGGRLELFAKGLDLTYREHMFDTVESIQKVIMEDEERLIELLEKRKED